MVAVFCFCWGPYASFAMINITGHGKVGDQKSESLQRFTNLTLDYQDIPLILTVLPLQLCKTVIVWNPVIFVLMNPMVQFSIFQLHRKSPLHSLNDSPNMNIYKLTLQMMQFSNFSNLAAESFHEYHHL